MENITANVNIASASCTWRDERALLDKSEYTGQCILDDVCTILVHFATKTDWVGHIAPHRCAQLFKFAEQKCFVGALGKHCLNRFDVTAGHGKDVRGAIDQAAVSGWLRWPLMSAPSSSQT